MPGFGTLVLLRHGQSILNAQERFTGLLDPPLTSRGREETRQAARILAEKAFAPDVIYSSTMTRAMETANIVAGLLTAGTLPIQTAWELVERNYGSLTGRLKWELLAEFGPEALHFWRRSLYAAPPPMSSRQLDAIRRSPAISTMLPGYPHATETLNDVAARVKGFWLETLRPPLQAGSHVLVVGHGNSLRALCLIIDTLSEDEVEGLNLPTGHPLEYHFSPRFMPTPRGGRYLDPLAAADAVDLLTADGGT